MCTVHTREKGKVEWHTDTGLTRKSQDADRSGTTRPPNSRNTEASSTRTCVLERSTRVRPGGTSSPTLGVSQGPATRKTKVRPSVLGRVMHTCLLPRFIHACTSSAHAAACRPRLTGPLTEPLAEPRKIRSGVLGGSCVVNLMCSAVRLRARAWARVRGRAMAMTD